MTHRTIPPPTPSDFAGKFVERAQSTVERCLARHPEVDRRAVVLRLTSILGGGWHLLAGGELLGSGTDPELDYATRSLIRATVSELDERSQSKLLQRMDGGREDLLPDAAPAHFRAQLVLEGLTWTVRISAHARGAGAVVGEVSGVLLEPARVAA